MLGPTPEFKETQWLIHNPWFAWLPAMFVVMYTSGFAALALRGVSTQTDLVMWVIVGLIVPAVMCTWRLRTEVVAGELRVSLPPIWGLGWRVSRSRVMSATSFRYRVFKDFGAYGVRRHDEHGWIWNALGNEAVRLRLDGAADRVIGTQRAQELCQALGVAMPAVETDVASEADDSLAA
ncbi:MAG: hypothetical protein ACI89L_000567 [Phycisphaerales bacterium]|jgi:hypothetical protein